MTSRTLRKHSIRLVVALATSVAAVGCGDDDDAASTTAAAESTIAVPTTAAPETTEAAATTAVVATTEAVETTATAATTAAPDTTATAAAGTPYTSAEGDYSVTFPGEPELLTQPQPLPDGSTIDLTLATYQFDGGNGFIATARGQYPDGYVLDVPLALQGGQDQAIANTGGTLISSQDITLQGRPGREFSATIDNGGQTGTQLQRIYLDGLVIYQQIFTGLGEATFTDPELAPFFDSFAFTTG